MSGCGCDCGGNGDCHKPHKQRDDSGDGCGCKGCDGNCHGQKKRLKEVPDR